jgi:hypothetical protein
MRACFIIAAVGAAAIAGCDVSPPSSAVTLTTTPDTLRVCDPPSKVTVAWNVKNADVAGGVKIYVLGAEGGEVLFVSSGSLEGTAETGAWAEPKQTFVLKNEDGTKELARFAIGSKDC